jgi:hydrogenase nickel incorporation protein HypA/HybF
MHELSIAVSIVDGVLEEADRLGAKGIEAIHLRVGRLSGVDKEALLFSYGVASQDTALAQSRLIIEDVEVMIFCTVCGREQSVRAFPTLMCGECGAIAQGVVRGDELEITRMEIFT